MTEQWLDIIAKKQAHRRELVALPLREKIEKIDALRARQDQIRRFRPVANAKPVPA